MNNTYVRLFGNIVCEVFVNTTDLTIQELFHIDLASQFEPCAQEDVQVGWFKRKTDGVFIRPPEVAIETIPTTQV
jgi:hypothetical protein